MRKLLLATIMAAVFVSGTVVGMIPSANAASGGGDPINQLVRRLNHVLDIVQRANDRYDQISADIGPGPVLDPAVIVALDSIKGSCESLIGKVNAALGTAPP